MKGALVQAVVLFLSQALLVSIQILDIPDLLY